MGKSSKAKCAMCRNKMIWDREGNNSNAEEVHNTFKKQISNIIGYKITKRKSPTPKLLFVIISPFVKFDKDG